MKKVLVGGVLPASEISLGCFRLHTADKARAAALVGAALEEGIDFFDNADIYGVRRCLPKQSACAPTCAKKF